MATHGETRYPLLRLIMRMDRAGSAYFIGLGVLTAPVLVLTDPPAAIVWLMWIGWIGFAIWLAALGVLMAWGLTRAARRGEELEEQWWRSIIDYPPSGGRDRQPPPLRRI